MPMAVINWLKVLHLIAVTMTVTGAMAQLFILSKYRRAAAAEAEASEKMALAIFRTLAFPGVMIAFLLGLGLAGVTGRFSEPWVHAKLTLVLIWVVLAHMQLRGMKRLVALRASGDIAALEKTKSVQLNIGRGISVLVLVIFYLAVFRLDAF
jgi:protoporphyrinogen IX oxidase